MEHITNTVHSTFNTYCAGPLRIPTQYDNMELVPEPSITKKDLWARVTTLVGSTDQASLGSETRTFRTVGRLVINLFVPANEGTGRIAATAGKVAKVFNAKTYSNVRFQSATVKSVGSVRGWYQVNVEAVFIYDSKEVG